MTIRAAIIGCGQIAGGYDEAKHDDGCYTHAGAYRACPEIELVAAADVNAERLESFGRHWSVPHRYTDPRRLLQEQALDLVSLCVPDALHEEMLLQVLAARPPRVIFAEKPLARGRQAARRVLDAARTAGTRIVLNNQRRWEPGHQRARALIQTGGLGQIVSVTAFYVKGLYHIGATASDLIRYLVDEVEAVQALDGAHQETVPGDPSMDAVLYLRNRAVAMLLGADRYGYRYSLFELDVLGTEGRIRIVDNGDRIMRFRVQDYAHYPGFRELRERPEEMVLTEMGRVMPRVAGHIVQFLMGQGDELGDTAEEGYQDLCVLDAIAASRAQAGARLPVRR